MTSQARISRLFRSEPKKRNDGRFSSMGFDMSTCGTVAALATCVRRFFFPARDASEMGILVKIQPDIRMTRFAWRTANIRALLGLLCLLGLLRM
jgi:hypothetical protein